MAHVFNAAEIIDMGVEKEKRRRDFYALAAERFSDRKLKDLFSRLKEWEESHIVTFSEIRKGIEQTEIPETYAGEFEAYTRAAVNDMLYDQVSSDRFSEYVKTPLQALEYGMGFEKDAILFFNEFASYLEPPYRDRIDKLVGEEKKHLVYLAELRREYR